MDFYSSSKLKNFTLEVVICSILMLLMVSCSTFLIIPVVVTVRELIDFRLSTHYVFIIGNLIVIIVVVQSSKMSSHKTELSSDDLKISREKVAQGGDRGETQSALLDEDAKKVKNVVKEKVVMIPECSQLYRRTISASYERGIRSNRMTRGELRWLSTVKCGGGGGKNFDDLSHEEFRRKIDTFIAKQQRLIRRM
ncbi:hypothetical protein QQ045_001221 [Rhodiola kirilowii]